MVMDLKNFLRTTVSAMAHAAASMNDPAAFTERKQRNADVGITRTDFDKAERGNRAHRRAQGSKRGQAFRRILAFQAHGPKYRQGDKIINHRLDGRRHVLVRYMEFRVLHATKGWRVYTDKVPNAVA